MTKNNSINTNYTLGTNFELAQPSQPAFEAYISADADNVTGDGTTYKVATNTERFDLNSDYNTGTYTYTAPITSRHLFGGTISAHDYTSSHTTGVVNLVTSNGTHELYRYNFGAVKDSDNRFSYTGSVFADMDLGDTAYIEIIVSNGTKVVDIDSGSTFWGISIC